MANPTQSALQAIINGGGNFSLGGIVYGPGTNNNVAPTQAVIDAIYASMSAVGHYPAFAQGAIGFADPNGVPISDPGLSWDNTNKILNSLAHGIIGAHGESGLLQWAEENLTLATGGLTSDTTANLLPANSLILAVVGYVTTTLTVTTSWGLSDPTTANRFAATNATLAAGTTSVGILQWSGAVTTLAAGPSQAAAAKARVTCVGSNPGAGAIRIGVLALVFSAPTS